MDFNQYIKPELLVIVPALILLGKLVKSSVVSDKHIPLILTALSIVLSCGYIVVISKENFGQAIVTGIIQGILLAAISVYGNQIIKQYMNKNGGGD